MLWVSDPADLVAVIVMDAEAGSDRDMETVSVTEEACDVDGVLPVQVGVGNPVNVVDNSSVVVSTKDALAERVAVTGVDNDVVTDGLDRESDRDAVLVTMSEHATPLKPRLHWQTQLG